MNPIPVNTPDLRPGDRQAVHDCLAAGWISSEGPQVAGLEEAFAAACGRRHGVAVSSGTAALDIAVRALGIGPGDEVLVPSLTIISCAHAIVEAGARPVPVDCDAEDWNAYLPHFEQRLTPRTRAVMLVHLYGLCGDLAPVLEWAAARGLLVVEDASQAQGLDYRGRPCGSFGSISVFSLYANKLVTTGEGGMIVCDDERLAQACRSLRNLCFDPARRFWHEELGWNYRLTAMQAALGTPQLRRLPELVARKRAIGGAYYQAFGASPWFRLAPPSRPWAENVYWVFGLVVAAEAPFGREEVTDFLATQGIGTRTFFYGLHEQPVLLARRLVDPVRLPVTEELSARGFYLPSGLGLADAEQQRVIAAVQAFTAERG